MYARWSTNCESLSLFTRLLIDIFLGMIVNSRHQLVMRVYHVVDSVTIATESVKTRTV